MSVTTRQSLIESLIYYKTGFSEEEVFKEQFCELLQHDRSFFRDHLPGHITASAWVIDNTGSFVLLTHHAKLNKWLQPGGHADGDEHVSQVALREAMEETGLKKISPLQPEILDIDIHTIPARKDFPEHLHFDIRFLFQASRSDTLVVTEESHELAWIHASEIPVFTNHNQSMIRMAAKVKRLF